MTTVIASKDPSEELQESQELLPLKVRKLATDLIEAIFRYSLPSKKQMQLNKVEMSSDPIRFYFHIFARFYTPKLRKSRLKFTRCRLYLLRGNFGFA